MELSKEGIYESRRVLKNYRPEKALLYSRTIWNKCGKNNRITKSYF